MHSMNYYITAGLSIFFLGGCLMYLKDNDIFSSEAIRKFKTLIFVLGFEIILDSIFSMLEGQNVWRYTLCIMKSIELFLNPVIAFLVLDIFYSKKNNRHNVTMGRLRIMMGIAIAVNGVLQTLVLFGWRIFYIDENNVYRRGNLVFVYIFVLASVVLMLAYGLLVFSSKTQGTMKLTLTAFVLILNVGILLRAIIPDSDYDFLCMSVSMLFLLLYYSHVTLRIDPLTHLLNRHVFTHLKDRIDYMTVVIVIDVNYFKQINDTYGHKSGDRSMILLARMIQEAYGKYAYCFRLGGDEFCVILKSKAFDDLLEKTPHYDVYAMAEGLMRRLDELIITRIESGDERASYLKYGVSQGYGVYNPLKKDRVPFDMVVELADKNMYCNKELFKEQFPKPSQEKSHVRARVLCESLTTPSIGDE